MVMQNYELILKSPIAKSFMCKKAANSLDIDVEKKSIHHLLNIFLGMIVLMKYLTLHYLS